jgi:hypothetical protein
MEAGGYEDSPERDEYIDVYGPDSLHDLGRLRSEREYDRVLDGMHVIVTGAPLN